MADEGYKARVEAVVKDRDKWRDLAQDRLEGWEETTKELKATRARLAKQDKAVNMHGRLVAFLKHHEEFEAGVAATDDFNCEPAMIPPTLYNDLLGMRAMRDDLLKEARGETPTVAETVIEVRDGKRACAASYDATKPQTPDDARLLARKLVACADAIDTAKARGDK